MTTVEINVAFMAHRKNCTVCASDGGAVCWVGMELLRMFHAVIIETSLEELKAQRKATA
jgi:hypothetical protein